MTGQAARADQWSQFWQEFGAGGAPQQRCHIPGDGLTTADQHWRSFVRALPHGARIIDLGCGAGILGRTLLQQRGDIHVTGVDFADVSPLSMPGLTVHAATAMEHLPFADEHFDAAVSQFGVEYGDMKLTVAQLARVLKPGAQFSFLVHHSDSEIVREGGVRQLGLRAMFSAKVKAAFLDGQSATFDRLRAQLLQQFCDEPSVRLFGAYFARTIHKDAAVRKAEWTRLASAIAPEIALTAQMERSAKSPSQLAAWLAPLIAAMQSVRIAALRRASGEPIGWTISGFR